MESVGMHAETAVMVIHPDLLVLSADYILIKTHSPKGALCSFGEEILTQNCNIYYNNKTDSKY